MKIKAGELTQEHVGWINLSDPDDVGHGGKQICGGNRWQGKVVVYLDHGRLYEFAPDQLLLDPESVIEIEQWSENE